MGKLLEISRSKVQTGLRRLSLRTMGRDHQERILTRFRIFPHGVRQRLDRKNSRLEK